jgi:opine dehydrogenase
MKRFAVIGAGNGGRAMAAHLALIGHKVALYNRTYRNIATIIANKGINLKSNIDGLQGFAKLSLVTSNIDDALKKSEIIMVVVPSSAHADIAKNVAPYLQDGQIIILNPGRTLGALEFTNVLRINHCKADVTIAEAETLVYISRSEGSASSNIFRLKETVPLAAFPAVRTANVLKAIQSSFPQFVDGISILHTGLNNVGAIFHPALMLLNAGWIEATKGNFKFYIEGLTPSVSRVLEALDKERLAVASSFGIQSRTALEWLRMSYNANGEDIRDAILNQSGYYDIKAPTTLYHRYVFDDIPMGLVPLASLGRKSNVSVPIMESIIRIGSIVNGVDYMQLGRTVDKLGLVNLSVDDITRFLKDGILR